MPVTASPYFGSGSSIECPPTIEAPAAATASAPPRRISRSTSGPSVSSGYATRFSALTGCPPIAYTSDSAFVAAIRPNAYGSSTIGVKKSTVCTIASESVSCTTPASSACSAATSTRGSVGRGSPATIGRRSAADSLQPQPAPWEREVRGTAIAFV